MSDRENIVLACTAPYGGGGLGLHFAHIVEMARAAGTVRRYYSAKPEPGDPAGTVVRDKWSPLLMRYTPLRFDPGAINHMMNQRFDRAVARQLEPPGNTSAVFVGFGGQAMHCFERAKALGYRRLELVAANSHVKNVERRHAQSLRDFPIERSWLNAAQVQKTLREYELADVIYCASEYTHQSFIAEGVPERKLARVNYPIASRFVPDPRTTNDGVFRVVYTGSLTVMKGIPVLLRAFARLPDQTARLTLIGGSGTRGMNSYLRRTLAEDPRVRVEPGDPLPHLRQADVYVHPSYEDGFAYAPMEALACGVPVIVTEDTGMKEHIREGVNGFVVPTGSADAIFERLQFLRTRGGG